MAFGMTAVGGAYTITWNGASLGIMAGDQSVPTLHIRAFGSMIDRSADHGALQLGGFYHGVRARASMRAMEYKAATISAFYPWSATNGVIGVIGRDFYDLSAALVMTATAGTPAATSPASITANKTLLAPDFDVSLLFGPILREVPLEFVLYPYTNSSNTVLYVTA